VLVLLLVHGSDGDAENSDGTYDLSTINGDLMVILWLKNGLTMVNNGMI